MKFLEPREKDPLHEGLQLFHAGSSDGTIYFVTAGAMVLYVPATDRLRKLPPEAELSMHTLAEQSRCFGVYRRGEHVGESEFTFQSLKLAAGYICPSTCVIGLSWTLMENLMARYPAICWLLERDGALRRVAREFDALFPTNQTRPVLREDVARKRITEFKQKGGLGDHTEDQAINVFEDLTREKKGAEKKGPEGMQSPRGARKTSHELHQEFIAARLIALHLESKYANGLLDEHGELATRSKPVHIGYYGRLNTQGGRFVHALKESGILTHRRPDKYVVDRNLLDMYLDL